MNKKFPYKYDINIYIDKAFEKMLYTYFWATKDMLDDRYEYSIEKEGNKYEYVYYYNQDGKKYRTVLDWIKTPEDFYNCFISHSDYKIKNFNPVKEVFKVESNDSKELTGWYLERYEFRLHELDSYSVYVQAGDRVAGASRTFYIPQDYFEGTYDDFLDKYCNLVTANFGFTKEELKKDKRLKEFLGFGKVKKNEKGI